MTQAQHMKIVDLCKAAKRASRTDRNKAASLYIEAHRLIVQHGSGEISGKGGPWEACFKLGVFTGARCYG